MFWKIIVAIRFFSGAVLNEPILGSVDLV